MKKIFLLFFTISLLSACSSPPTKSNEEQAFDARLYSIYINEKGDIKQPGDMIGQDSPEDRQSFEDNYVNNILRNIEEVKKTKPDLKVVVFIHGGLNTSKNVWERVNDFSSQMLKENRYPIFVGWNSGGVANYFDHLLRIRQGARYGVVKGWASSPFVLMADVGRSVGRIPAGIARAASDLMYIPISNYSDEERDYQVRMNRIGGEYKYDLRDWVGSKFNITSRHPFQLDHLRDKAVTYGTVWNPAKFLVTPFLDGFGSGAWDSMLRRTDLVLSKPMAFEGAIPTSTPENFGDTAVTTLLKRLEERQFAQKEARTKPMAIDLIGHSMGAIVVNNILTRHPSLAIDNVVFMGAAAPVKDVENVIVPWLRRQPKTDQVRFYNLSIDQYRELSENFYWDFAPRGSLLRWIDTIFGEVNSFKDRTAGSWWNIIRAAEDVFPPDVRSQVHLTRFSMGGAEYGPQQHGEFDNYYFWRKEFWCAESGLSTFKPASLRPRPEERKLPGGACTTTKLKNPTPSAPTADAKAQQ